MRLLIVINSIDASEGGTSNSSTSVISELSKQGRELDITLLTRESSNPVLKNFQSPNVRIIFSKGIVFALLRNFTLFRNIDVIHVQGLWSLFPTLIGIWVKLFSKASLIVSPRGMLEPWSLQQRKGMKKIALWTYQGFLFRLADTFHVTAPEEAVSVSTLLPSKHCAVIPNGIATANFQDAMHSDNTETRTILFLSRIHPKKGIEILIKAWSLLQSDWSNWNVRIIGNGDQVYIDSLKELITHQNIERIQVEKPVYGNEKRDVYSASDLFVLPTFSENFGIVVAEAMASRLPVITTTGTPWSELKLEHCGEIIGPNVEELTLALKKWMSYSPQDRKEAGIRGKQLINRKYSIDSVASSFYSLYLSIR